MKDLKLIDRAIAIFERDKTELKKKIVDIIRKIA